jgi:hypothetical protein
MKYQERQKKAPRFAAMTGYTEEKFSELLPYFYKRKTLRRHKMNIYRNTGWKMA